jgi:N6-adenosine-specific RNA methylase IME4
LFGVRGSVPYKMLPGGKRAQSTTLLTCPRSVHSRKPEEMRERIERVSYGPMLEMFARPQEGLFEQSPLWTFIGHGAGGKDISDDLRLLAETK